MEIENFERAVEINKRLSELRGYLNILSGEKTASIVWVKGYGGNLFQISGGKGSLDKILPFIKSLHEEEIEELETEFNNL